MDELIQLLKEQGFGVAVAVYLIWQSRRDYVGVCKRLNSVEDYCRTKCPVRHKAPRAR